MLKVSLLTIGDEICIGQIINTNAAWMADKVTALGASVILHSSIGDSRDAIVEELDRLIPISDIILITGGLGPTHDDITKKVLCDYFNDELVIHELTLQRLTKFFAERGRELSERNAAQAELPSRCKVLPNDVGTAPGMLFERGGKKIYSMPGVPFEMKFIMGNSVLPMISYEMNSGGHPVTLYKTVLANGIPEAYLADLIGDTELFLNGGSLAFLPSPQGIRLRIGFEAGRPADAQAEIDRIEKYIMDKAGQYILSDDATPVIELVSEKLKISKKTIAVAESCTGGLLSAEFTNIAGSSEYFIAGEIVYSNEAKIKCLGVKPETIEKFGAVSQETSLELAENVRKKHGTDYSIAITGVAGPSGGTPEKPVGTIWIGISSERGTKAELFVFGRERDNNRRRSVTQSLLELLKELK